MQVRKQQLELDMEQWTDSKLGKEYVKAVYCHPAYLISVQTTLMAEGKEELKSLLMKVKQKSEKVDLTQHSENKDHGIQSHHFMENRWGNYGSSKRLYFLGLPNHCR